MRCDANNCHCDYNDDGCNCLLHIGTQTLSPLTSEPRLNWLHFSNNAQVVARLFRQFVVDAERLSVNVLRLPQQLLRLHQVALIACEAQVRQYQLSFDQEECRFNTKIAEDEKFHNRTLASKLEHAVAEAHAADAAAAVSREIAAAAWFSDEAVDDEGTGIKSKKQQAAKGHFDTFFKMRIEEEEQRRIMRKKEQ